jgi:internalin A
MSMMESCGIAFALKSRWGGRNEHTRWVAPAMLPPRAAMERDIAREWDFDSPIETCTLDYGFLHDGLIRSLMAEVGAQAGYGGVYWDQGFVVYETSTRSRLLVEATKADDWTGQINLRARGPQAGELLSRMDGLLQRAETRAGLTRCADTGPPEQHSPERSMPAQIPNSFPDAGDYGQPALQPATKFGFPEQTQPLFALSYAWKNADHPDLETAVDAIEAAARLKNAIILRDKNEMQVGNRISVFARRLSQAPHAIVVLSHKYLTVQEHCMQELFLIYRQLQSDPVELAARVHFWVLPCAPIHDEDYRNSIIKHWEAKAGRTFGPSASDKAGTTSAINRTSIANEIGPILAAVDDSARETDFDAFLERCFKPVDSRLRP